MDPFLWCLAAALAGAGARWLLSRTFRVAAIEQSECGLTGEEVARLILADQDEIVVQVVPNGAWLSDHYDAKRRTISLSSEVGPERSVAAIAVAAHEAAHALQDIGAHSILMRVRRVFAPVAALASLGYMLILMAAFFLGLIGLLPVAMVMLLVMLACHLVTLPVEIEASRTGLRLAREWGLLAPHEVVLAKRVLWAAAATYLVACLALLADIAWLSDDD